MVDNIPTDLFNQILLQYVNSGWRNTFEYDGFDAWIDYGNVILEKDGEKLVFEWTNWLEGEISGSEKEVALIRQRVMKQEAISTLNEPPSRSLLLKWIGWLDRQPFEDDDEDKLPYQLVYRSILAGGYLLLENYDGLAPRTRSNVENTIDALERYVLAPSVERYEVCWAAATLSYPFGAGDGCLSVPDLGVDGCEVGSGCRSGAGSIYQIGLLMGDVAVMRAISAELLPWLQNDHDPVEQRILNS